MVTLIELAIVFLAIFMGVRHGGLALGFWGGLGLIVLAVVFGAPDRRYADHLGRLHGRLLHGSCRRLGHSR